MAPRANWKGYLKLAELSCPVALYTAASTAERVAFHMLNRRTGHRLTRQFVDRETGKPVEREEQVKGFELGTDDYVILEPDEIAAAVPESDKTLAIGAFVPCGEVDEVYFDKPYYLAPDGRAGDHVFELIREGLAKKKVAALASAVLFRRVRTLLIRPDDKGLVATTLNFDYEVRTASEAFRDIKPIKISGEMLELAKHIIATKKGAFDPAAFDDRYEAALVELVKAKMEGRAVKPAKAPPKAKVVDLMDALRRSAEAVGAKTAEVKTAAAKKKPAAAPRRKAG